MSLIDLPPLRRWQILRPNPRKKQARPARYELYCVVAARSEEEAHRIANRQTTCGKDIRARLESPEETTAVAAYLNSYWKPSIP